MPMPDPMTLLNTNVVVTHRWDKIKPFGSDKETPFSMRGVVLRVDSAGLLIGDGTRTVFFSFAEIDNVRIV